MCQHTITTVLTLCLFFHSTPLQNEPSERNLFLFHSVLFTLGFLVAFVFERRALHLVDKYLRHSPTLSTLFFRQDLVVFPRHNSDYDLPTSTF
jgi:hypothetical protein